MPDYAAIFETLLQQQEATYDNAYDHADTALVQQLNIAFWPITNKREQRLKLLSSVVGRELSSTLDLKVGEVHTLLKLLDQDAFVAAMKGDV